MIILVVMWMVLGEIMEGFGLDELMIEGSDQWSGHLARGCV